MPHRLELNLIVKLGQLVILIFFGGTALWLTFAPLHGAVIAPGSVKVENYRKTIQLNEGGILKQIFIREGDHVKQGQNLLALEDSEAAAAFGVLRSALDALIARKGRLEVEAVLGNKIPFPAQLQERNTDPSVIEAVEREKRLFTAKKEILNGQIISLEKQIKEIEKEHSALSSQVAAERNSESTAKDELATYNQLRERNFIATPKLLEQQRKVFEYQSRSEEHLAEASRTLRQREELKLKILTLRSDYVRAASEELKDVSSKVIEFTDRIRPAEETLKRRIVKAPVSGTILGLKANTIGSAIAPRDPLLEIVPENSELLIEAQVSVDSIKELHIGQKVEIRFPALPYRTTPLVEGKLVYVAADAQVTKDGRPYFLIQVIPDPESMHQHGLPPIQPGMAAEAYIQTQARTALEYFIKPITDTVAHSFRER